MGRPRCVFSYYGSKSRIASRYPAPKHDLIVEPFAGAASYALLHRERDVILNELNPRTWSIWNYLLGTPLEQVLAEIPPAAFEGQKVVDLISTDNDSGLIELIRANCNMGAAGAQVTETVTMFAEVHWPDICKRLKYYLPQIQHWQLLPCGDYATIAGCEATWFVDPPYDHRGKKKKYTYHVIDYTALSAWCRQLRGQVVVCENVGAQWLPFRSLTAALGRGNTSPAAEVIWTNDYQRYDIMEGFA